MAGVLAQAAERTAKAVRGLKDPRTVLDTLQSIKALEQEGDALYQQAVGDLFSGSPDPLDVIKWKSLYDGLEDAIDACQHAAVVIERIALKHL